MMTINVVLYLWFSSPPGPHIWEKCRSVADNDNSRVDAEHRLMTNMNCVDYSAAPWSKFA
jgi:hypothetical protein